MVDLGATGRVVGTREMMNLREFSKIGLNRCTRTDVEREFGRPGSADRVASWSGDILNYRWLGSQTRMLLFVYLDANDVVQRTAQGFDVAFLGRD